MTLFKNRSDAGKKLAVKLKEYSFNPDTIVLGLPRGGVVVAYEIAMNHHLPMDVFIVRKLGVPGHEELAMGAIASGDIQVLNNDIVASIEIDEQEMERTISREKEELKRQEERFRGNRPFTRLENREIIIADDGLATGATMRAAVEGIKSQGASRIIVAVPVAPPEVYRSFTHFVDKIICLETPFYFGGVGAWYDDFHQTTDEEVKKLLNPADGL